MKKLYLKNKILLLLIDLSVPNIIITGNMCWFEL